MWQKFIDFFFVAYHMVVDNISYLMQVLVRPLGDIFGENASNVIKQVLQGLQDWYQGPILNMITDWWIEQVLTLWDMPFLAVFFGAGLFVYIMFSVIKWVIGIVM